MTGLEGASAAVAKKIGDKAIATSGKLVGKLSPLITLMESAVKEEAARGDLHKSPSHGLDAGAAACGDLHLLYVSAQTRWRSYTSSFADE